MRAFLLATFLSLHAHTPTKGAVGTLTITGSVQPTAEMSANEAHGLVLVEAWAPGQHECASFLALGPTRFELTPSGIVASGIALRIDTPGSLYADR